MINGTERDQGDNCNGISRKEKVKREPLSLPAIYCCSRIGLMTLGSYTNRSRDRSMLRMVCGSHNIQTKVPLEPKTCSPFHDTEAM